MEFALIKPARIIEGAGTNHWFHNDLTNRSQIMLLALTGNVGKPGSGFDHYVGHEKIWPEAAWFTWPSRTPGRNSGSRTPPSGPLCIRRPPPISTATIPGRSSYVRESVDKGWMPLWPKDTLDTGRAPHVLFIWGANYVNQSKGFVDLVNTLLPKIGLIVDLNVRMDTSATFADVVIPAASMFEKYDLNTTDLHTFAIPFTPVIDPQFECRTGWQIWRNLAMAIQDRAASRGFPGFTDDFTPFGATAVPPLARDFTKLLLDFDTLNIGGGDISQDKAAAQFILDNAVETPGFTLDGNPRTASDAEAALFRTVRSSSIPSASPRRARPGPRLSRREWPTTASSGCSRSCCLWAL